MEVFRPLAATDGGDADGSLVDAGSRSQAATPARSADAAVLAIAGTHAAIDFDAFVEYGFADNSWDPLIVVAKYFSIPGLVNEYILEHIHMVMGERRREYISCDLRAGPFKRLASTLTGVRAGQAIDLDGLAERFVGKRQSDDEGVDGPMLARLRSCAVFSQ